jgi:trimethylamine--corrinoid protein Co-methyltransferase
MIQSTFVKPVLTLLEEDQITLIHDLSLKILQKVGIQVGSKSMRVLLEEKLGKKGVQGDRVFLPAELVEWAIDVSPSTIPIYNRMGDLAFQLGGDRTRFGPGVTTLHYMEPATEKIVPFARRHMREAVRLGDSLPYFDVISTIGVLQDVPIHLADLLGTLEMIANTTKPLVLLISDEDVFPNVLDLIEHCHGDLNSKPFILPYFNPITPLKFDQGICKNMRIAIERDLPIILSSYGMVGASTPITMTDTFALLNAELLAGLTIAQLIKEGTAVILGPMPSFFDMKTMVTFYDPHSMLLNLAFAELMAHYQVPHCGTSGSTTGWGPDIVSTEELMMNHLTSSMGKVGLAPFVGSLHDGKVFSPENMIHAHEIIAKAIRFSKGLRLDERESDLDELRDVGPGGNFLMTDRTLHLFRAAYEESPIFPRWSLETWMEKGSPNDTQLLRDHTLEMINALEPLADFEELIAAGEAFIHQMPSLNSDWD